MKKILFLSLAIFGFSAVFAQLKVSNAYGSDLTVAIGKQSKIVPQGATAVFDGVRLKNVWLNCLTPEGETFAIAKQIPRSGKTTIYPSDNQSGKKDVVLVAPQKAVANYPDIPHAAELQVSNSEVKEANYADGSQSLSDILSQGAVGTNTGLKPTGAPMVTSGPVNTDPTPLDDKAQVYLGGDQLVQVTITETQLEPQTVKVITTTTKPTASKRVWLKSLVPGHQIIFEPDQGEVIYLTYSQRKKIEVPLGEFPLKISYVDLSTKTVKTVLIPQKVSQSDQTIQITPADLTGGEMID